MYSSGRMREWGEALRQRLVDAGHRAAEVRLENEAYVSETRTMNVTYQVDVGPVVVVELDGWETDKPFDAHLQVSEPDRFIDLFAEAGCGTLIVHLESTIHLRRLLARIKGAGCMAGIALNPATSIEPLKYLYPDLTQVIVLTVDAGFKAQPFTAGVLPKMATVHDQLVEGGYDAVITADGSVNPRTIEDLVRSGSRILVLGSTGLFNEPDFAAALARVRAQAEAAVLE